MTEDERRAVNVVTALVAFVPTTLWAGLVMSIVWGWYAVPTLGLPPISAVEAIGLRLVISAFHHPTPPKAERGTDDVLYATAWGFLMPAMVLLFAWAWRFLL